MHNNNNFEELQKIEGSAYRLKSYLEVLKIYTQNEMIDNDKIGHIYTILNLAEKEIKRITSYCWVPLGKELAPMF